MGKYIGKRILLLVPAVFLVCVIVFALMRLVPGDAVDSIIYKYSSMGISADRAEVEAMLGLDQPAVAQFFTWLKGVLTGDLGDSLFEYESVASIIGRQLPVTLELGILTLLFSCILSIPIGLFCAGQAGQPPRLRLPCGGYPAGIHPGVLDRHHGYHLSLPVVGIRSAHHLCQLF